MGVRKLLEAEWTMTVKMKVVTLAEYTSKFVLDMLGTLVGPSRA